MKFIVEKEDIQKVANIATKLVGKFLHGCLVSDGKELRIVINSNNYVNILVPTAQVTGKGIVALQSEVFTQLFALRGKTLKAEFDVKQNKLNVECGSKVSFYVIALASSDIEIPEINKKNKLKLTAKTTGFLKSMLNIAKYESPDIDTNDYALLMNTKNEFNILCSSNNSFAFYTHKEPISKEPFSITAPISLFKMAFEICSSAAEIYITDNLLMVCSDNFIITFPALQDNTEEKTMENFKWLSDKGIFKKGKVEFEGQKLISVLKSIRAISGGTDIVSFALKGEKIYLELESKYGKSKDVCAAVSNTLGNLKLEMSELFLNSTLSMANNVNNKITLSLEKELKFYKLESSTENYSLSCFGPLLK